MFLLPTNGGNEWRIRISQKTFGDPFPEMAYPFEDE